MASDVDAIWASLKATSAPSQHAARAKALLRDATLGVSSDSKKSTHSDRAAAGKAEGCRALLSRVSVTKSSTGDTHTESTTNTVEGGEAGGPKQPKDAVQATTATGDARGDELPNASSSNENADDEKQLAIDSAVPAIESADSLKKKVARDVNVLSDLQSPPTSRVLALRRIQNVATQVDPRFLTQVAVDCFAKPALRRLEDKSERVREGAIDLFVVVVQQCQRDEGGCGVVEILPYAVPALRHRLGPVGGDTDDDENENRQRPAREKEKVTRLDPTEPSEEIRLKLLTAFINTLRAASTSGSENAIAAYASDLVSALTYAADDSFSEVVCEACVGLDFLTQTLGRRLAPVAKKLAWTFAPNLTHKKSKVRVATLDALRQLMHCGAHETILDLCAFKHPNLVPIKAFYGEDLKVNYFGKLVLDTVPQVRFAFIQTLGDWMTSLVERVDHEPRLLPYVVSAVADGDTKVSTYALELIEKLGAQYEMEHEKDLKPVMTYMPEFLEGVSLHNTHVKSLYPAPFLERPRLGARVLVKNNFPAVVNPILAEIGGWQAEARVRAAKLLRANLVFLEENATQHCQQLCVAFVKVMSAVSGDTHHQTNANANANSQNDSARQRASDVVPVIGECCRLIGAFVTPNEWLEVALGMCGDETESPSKAGALVVIAELCGGASIDAMEKTPETGASPIDKILSLLQSPAIYDSSDTSVRVAVCRVVEILLRARPETWGRKDRVARLVGAALRAARGDSPKNDSSEARAFGAALAAAATALRCTPPDVVSTVRSELLNPLAVLPPKAWRVSDASALAQIVSARGVFSKDQTSVSIRLCSLVAFSRVFGNKTADATDSGNVDTNRHVRSIHQTLVSFPFVRTTNIAERLSDEDVVLLVRTALQAVSDETRADKPTKETEKSSSSSALAAITEALDGNISSTAAVFHVTGEITARVVSVLENCGETPADVRARVVDLARALAVRVTERTTSTDATSTDATSTDATSTDATSTDSNKGNTNANEGNTNKESSVLAAPVVLARLIHAVAQRLDDADGGARLAAVAALAAIAALSPLAAYHCVKAATATHLVDACAEADTRAGAVAVLVAAHAFFPGATRAAVERTGDGFSGRDARVLAAAQAGATGTFSEKETALEFGLPETGTGVPDTGTSITQTNIVADDETNETKQETSQGMFALK